MSSSAYVRVNRRPRPVPCAPSTATAREIEPIAAGRTKGATRPPRRSTQANRADRRRATEGGAEAQASERNPAGGAMRGGEGHCPPTEPLRAPRGKTTRTDYDERNSHA